MSGPDRRIPKRWTEAEDKILLDEVQNQLWSGSGQVKDWTRVAAKLPGRTNKDCRKRWTNKVCGNLKKGAWDEEEDARLRNAVNQYGQRWTLVANVVGSRSSDQCAKRWQHRLDPRLEHEDWTPDEDDLLLEDVQSYGREWKFIQEQDFPTRSPNDLKNRYSTLSRRLSKSANSASVDSTDGFASAARSDSAIVVATTARDTTSLLPADGINPPGSSDGGDGARLPVDDPSHDSDWLSHHHIDWTPPSLPTSPAHDGMGMGAAGGRAAGATFGAAGGPSLSWLDSTSFFANPAGSASSLHGADNTNGPAAEGTAAQALPWGDGSLPDEMMVVQQQQQQQQADDDALVGRVSLVVEHCDRDTLGHLLNVQRTLRGKGKLQIEHDQRP